MKLYTEGEFIFKHWEENMGELYTRVVLYTRLYCMYISIDFTVKPLDLIQPYRLEMGTKFSVGKFPNLHTFWKQHVTQKLNEVV